MTIPVSVCHSLEEWLATSHTEVDNSIVAVDLGGSTWTVEGIRANIEQASHELQDPLTEHFGRGTWDSAYRSPALNAAVGGSKTSRHMIGCAVDRQWPGLDYGAVVRWVSAQGLPIDQIILEERRRGAGGFVRWLHVGGAPVGHAPRRMFLYSPPGGGYVAMTAEQLAARAAAPQASLV